MNYDEWASTTGPKRPGTRCSICSNPKAAADFVRFVEDVQSGKVVLSLNRFHRTYLAPTYGIRANSTAYNHLHACLGIADLAPIHE